MTQLCSCLMGGGIKKVEGKGERAQPTREGGQLIVKSQGGTSCDRTEISVREPFKNVLAGTPLTENCRKFSSKNGSKRAKIGVFWPKIAVFSGFFP